MAWVAQCTMTQFIQFNADSIRIFVLNHCPYGFDRILGDMCSADQNKVPIVDGYAMYVGILKGTHKGLPKNPGKDSTRQVEEEGY
jgi:hypothetical protein